MSSGARILCDGLQRRQERLPRRLEVSGDGRLNLRPIGVAMLLMDVLTVGSFAMGSNLPKWYTQITGNPCKSISLGDLCGGLRLSGDD